MEVTSFSNTQSLILATGIYGLVKQAILLSETHSREYFGLQYTECLARPHCGNSSSNAHPRILWVHRMLGLAWPPRKCVSRPNRLLISKTHIRY